MVKGVSKQVIVVRPPDKQLFEQAIFILRDGTEGVSEEQLLLQARQAADRYLRCKVQGGRGRGLRLWPVLFLLLGGFTATVLWMLWGLLAL